MFTWILRRVLPILALAFAGSALADTTVTLRNGLNSYTGTTDTWICACNSGNGNYGAEESFVTVDNHSALVRFAIFASEGGPVPDGATITSATLSLYKFSSQDGVFKATRLLKGWNESQVTWNIAATGTSWTTPGALSAGSDLASAPDGQGSVGAAAAWLNIDVTSGVEAFANGTPNHGWRLGQVSSSAPGTHKNFTSSEHTSSTFRPTLVISYTTDPTPPSKAVTLMQGLNSYTGTTDTWICACNSGNGNYGAEESFVTVDNHSALVRFAIFASEGGPVPDGATITSATLSLYKFSSQDGVFKATRLLKSWNESQVTWNIAATGTSWTTPGALSAGSDVAATADGQGSVGAAAGWLNIDVTSGVQAFSGGTPNHGWRLGQVSSSAPGTHKNFTSSEHTSSTFRPKLTITYSSAEPIAHLAANPASGTAPLNVTFNASGSTPGTTPITSLRLQFGDGTADANWTDKDLPQSHSYTAAGTYTASLTVTDSNGASSTNSRTITVVQTGGPTAQLGVNTAAGTAPLSVTFNASGSTHGGSPSLRIQFGDGTADVTWSDKNQPQSHNYTTAGTYTATLTVTDSSGLSSTDSEIIQVSTGGSEIVPTTAVSGVAVPTFHSMSLYYKPASAPSNQRVWVQYRRATESAWRQGWPLWFDPRTSGGNDTLPYVYPARGSVVYLQPNTKYFFEFGTGASHATATWHHHVAGTTWSENFPKHPVETDIPTGASTYVITVGGTKSAYKVYDGGNNLKALPGAAPHHECVRVEAPFVIVRRLKCTGGLHNAILVAANVTNVVIEDSDLSDWSFHEEFKPNWLHPIGGNEQGAIELEGNNSGIVIQRNKIYDPHHGSFPWDIEHPRGPVGIKIRHGGMQNVIRDNEIYATGNTDNKSRWFQDGIMGSQNFSTQGAPGSDSDIYHNNVRNVFDDPIEAEGGGMNVRIWGNYIDHVGAGGIATSPVHFGPMYVFRNIINRSRKFHTTSAPDGDGGERGVAFKAYGMGSSSGYGGGRQYFFNNTTLQQPGISYSPPQQHGLGVRTGIIGANGSLQGIRQTCSRNNVFHVTGPDSTEINIRAGGANNDFDYDLSNSDDIVVDGGQASPVNICSDVNPSTFEQNGVLGTPNYKANHGWSAFPRLSVESSGPAQTEFGSGFAVGQGNFQLNTGSPGLNAGTPLANFTFDIDNTALARKSGVEAGTGSACSGTPCPDMGAHDSASPDAMKFGLPASQ